MIAYPRSEEGHAATIKARVIGLGNAGVHLVDRLTMAGHSSIDIVALNTDSQSLASSVAPQKIALGQRITRGLGTGGDPELGYEAAQESLDEIRALIDGRPHVVRRVWRAIHAADAQFGNRGSRRGRIIAPCREQCLADAPGGDPEVLLLATGSEVALCLAAHETLVKEGLRSRVVSMPSWELFEHQSQEYKDSVIPPAVKARVSVEQASTLGWDRYVGLTGAKIGMSTFGASAPLQELQKKFGFEPERVAQAAREQVARSRA